MVNNFKILNDILSFNDNDTFYFLQILKRRKDNPDLNKDVKLIKNIFLYKKEDLFDKEDYIIDICNINNARAYLRLNSRSLEKIALQTIRKVSELLVNGDHRAVRDAYNSCCGSYSSDKNKKWIVDVDDVSMKQEVIDYINILHSKIDNGYRIIADVPTKNGCHIISNPFNLKDFSNKFKDVEVKKDNPTILYTI